MNVYRGCTHGCIYCDSRSVCYRVGHDFEDVEVKRGAGVILESQLRRRRGRCMIGTGSMCDSYIPLEVELGVVRECLLVIEKYGFGLAIQTKSAGILRDLEVLQRINRRAKCVVQVTLTTYDEALCQKIEPYVSTSRERFEVLKIMRDTGIPTVVWLCPILPFINDTEENLRGLLDYCIKAGVRGILCFGFGVTLREGSREYFYSKVDEHFPGLKEKYIKQYGSTYACSSPNNNQLMNIFQTTCKQHNILYKPEDVFAYLRKMETKKRQTTLF